ncbi:MAG: hypothetical protein KF916_06450 [Microbacteriaceae bacterium]|nr:hypothetical protein [Microbacteriaceae bacterium]
MNKEVSSTKNRGLLIGLAVLIALLLVAIIVLIFMQLSNNAGNNGENPGNDDSDPSTNISLAAEISSFTTNSPTTLCATASADYEGDVNLNWSISNATTIALAIGPTEVDATTVHGIAGLQPAVTNFNDLRFPCDQEFIIYSLTAIGEDGQKVTKSLTIDREVAPEASPVLSSTTWTDGLDYVICTSFSTNEKVKKAVSWESSSTGEVKIYLATSDSTYPKNSDTHKLVASGLPVSGSYEVTIDCGNTGYSSYFSVMVRIENGAGLKNMFVKGNTAS